jgi:hypothetical protein
MENEATSDASRSRPNACHAATSMLRIGVEADEHTGGPAGQGFGIVPLLACLAV